MNWLLAPCALFLLGLVARNWRWLWAVPLVAGAALTAEALRRNAYSDSEHAVVFSALLVAYATLPSAAGFLVRVLAGRLNPPEHARARSD